MLVQNSCLPKGTENARKPRFGASWGSLAAAEMTRKLVFSSFSRCHQNSILDPKKVQTDPGTAFLPVNGSPRGARRPPAAPATRQMVSWFAFSFRPKGAQNVRKPCFGASWWLLGGSRKDQEIWFFLVFQGAIRTPSWTPKKWKLTREPPFSRQRAAKRCQAAPAAPATRQTPSWSAFSCLPKGA